MITYVLESCGGIMPTQATGRTAGNRPFYFRARHGSWSLEVGDAEWPTDYSEWPGDFPPGKLVASGDDDSWGCMERADVERILELHLVGY